MFVDLQIPLVFAGFFGIAIVCLLIVYKYGIKQITYEEAVAEQRQQTNALLGIKPHKIKDKKNKKPKKSQNPNEDENRTNKSDIVIKSPEEPIVKVEKQMTKDEPKANISVSSKKNNEIVSQVAPNAGSNAKAVDKESSQKVIESPIKSKKVVTDEKPKRKQPQIEKIVNDNAKNTVNTKTENVKNNSSQLPPSTEVTTNIVKEKKKNKKNDAHSLHQLSVYTNETSLSVLLDILGKAELSCPDVQCLIDLLLNKQHESPKKLGDWSEGKYDPVQKLKKQLAEKESLLAELQDAVQIAQSKVRDIRADHLSDRSQLQQKIRSYDELCQNKQHELSQLHTQINKLQNQISDQLVIERKLHDELQTLNIQRNQYEMRITQNKEEAEVVLKQLRQEIAEINTVNKQLRVELQHVSDEKITERTRSQAIIVQLKEFQNELEQKKDKQRQLEERQTDYERQLEREIRLEKEQKIELARLNAILKQQNEKIQHLENSRKQLQDDVFHVEQLQKDHDQAVQELKEERCRLRVTLEEYDHQQMKLLALHKQVASSKNEIEATTIKYNEDITLHMKQMQVLQNELEEQKGKNDDLRQKNWKVMEALKAAESTKNESTTNASALEKCKEEILQQERLAQKEFLERLFPDLTQLADIDPQNVYAESGIIISKYLQNLFPKDKVQLLEQEIKHYKTVIKNSEAMLGTLQEHVEKEEINWRMQLENKNEELETLRNSYASQMADNLAQLQVQLKNAETEKETISQELESLRNSTQVIIEKDKGHSDKQVFNRNLQCETANFLEGECLNGEVENYKSTNGSATEQPSTNGPSSLVFQTKTLRKKKKGNQ